MKSKSFPIFNMINDFESKSFHFSDIKAQHRSLYYFLINVLMHRRGANQMPIAYDYGMAGSKIGNHKTYTDALKVLEIHGFLKYTPGKNRFTSAIIDMQFCKPTANLLQTYCESIGVSTANNYLYDIDDIDNKEDINNKKSFNIDHNDFSKANFDNLKDAANDLHDTTDHPRTIPIAQTEKYSFEEFWSLYNKKVGKQKAEKLYSKTTLAERERIMTKHLPYYLKQQPDSKFRKHPEGYLNQKLFNDEIPEETAAAAPEQIWFPKFPHLHKKQA